MGDCFRSASYMLQMGYQIAGAHLGYEFQGRSDFSSNVAFSDIANEGLAAIECLGLLVSHNRDSGSDEITFSDSNPVSLLKLAQPCGRYLSFWIEIFFG